MISRTAKAAALILAAALSTNAWAGPRPDLMRENWQSLNGEWGFAFDPDDRGIEQGWFERDSLPEKITVPYPVESHLSGLAEKHPPNVCWYMRKFNLKPALDWHGRDGKLLLHFGAVDYEAEVWLNGIKLGGHTGGYTPFSFDITELARPASNVLVVRVFDSLDRMQVRGKQSPSGEPHGIMYTPVTGIWQTVWIERTGDPYVISYRFTPAADLSGGEFKIKVNAFPAGTRPWLKITGPNGEAESPTNIKWDGLVARWKSPVIEPWYPDLPALYSVEIGLMDAKERVMDKVSTYVGVRTIGVSDGKIVLNGKPFYQKLLLDQGYFPGGIYTPADDHAMKADVEMYKKMGFNGLRKHQKVEDPRFLYWCDKLGLVVWEEMPSLGFGAPRRVPEKAMQSFSREWAEVIDRDYNHPSIITWTVYNETWGIYEMLWRKGSRDWARGMTEQTRDDDPSRLVCDNSGGWHFDTDVWDFHHYLPTAEASRRLYDKYDFQPGDHLGLTWYYFNGLFGTPVLPIFFRGVDYQGQPIVLSEYGGFGFYPTAGEKGLLELYRDYTLAVNDYPYIQGYCYTQPYDVEQEQNGLMTFEREPKVDPEKIREINDSMGW